MKLEYKILWIEDEERWLRVPKKKLEEAIEAFGFIPLIDTIVDCDFSKMRYDDYDLILVDYKLEKCMPKQYGNEVLSELRNKKLLADAIFYSSSNIDDLYEKIKQNRIQNISVMERASFLPDNISQVIDIIQYFLKKELDLNSMRGIVMAEVANFDNKIWTIIKKLNITKEHIITYIKQKREEYQKDFEKYTDDEIMDLLDDVETSTIYFSSGARGTFLKNAIIEMAKSDTDLGQYAGVLKKYFNEITAERNKLGHRETINADDEEKFKSIRRNLIKHKDNLTDLRDSIEQKASATKMFQT